MDRFDQPLSQEAYTRVRKVDELDDYKKQSDLELEEIEQLELLRKIRKPIGD